MKIKIAASVFGKKGKDPMTLEEFLGGVAKNLAKSEYTTPEDISKKLPEFEKLYNEIYNTIETPTESLSVPENKSELVDGQLYNVNGQSMKWNKKKDNFE